MESVTENLPTKINGTNKVALLSNETISALVLNGDLSRLNGPQKVEYYQAFCGRVGLDPATQPFKILRLSGKEVLYCDRGGAAQLNKQHLVSHKITERKKEDDIYSVIANASTPDGRQSESIGAVSIFNLKGDALANAMMKAETKAKRRSTLDLLGLGMLDESELSTIPNSETLSLPNKNINGIEPIEIHPHQDHEMRYEEMPETDPELEIESTEEEIKRDPDLENVKKDVRKKTRSCYTKEDFAKLSDTMRSNGGLYVDSAVTKIVNKAYAYRFPSKQKGAQ